MRPIFCEDAVPVIYNLFDFGIAPPLLWYAYVPMLFLLFFLSISALFFNKFDRNSKLLTAISFSLAFWIIVTFLQWIAAPITLVMFSWELWGFAGALTYFTTALFVYSFIYDKPAPSLHKTVLLLLMFPILIFMPTNLNMTAFDLSWCEGVSHTSLLVYTYIYQAIVIMYVAYIGLIAYRKKVNDALSPKLIAITVLGAVSFLSLFLAVNVWGDLIDDYRVELIGPIGAIMFIVGISYTAVNYKKFEIRALGSEILIIALIVVLASILFIHSLEYIRYVITGSLVLVLIVGLSLAHSIRRETEQMNEIEHLAKRLKRANGKLKELDKLKSEFVSIASHQLRSPLTSIRGYASMLMEGSFGKVPDKAMHAVERIADSSKYMASSIEDYLSVSRIEAGNMKYELSDFNLKDEAERIVDDKRQEALKKGLVLTFKSDLTKKGIVHADIGKTEQILHNLINNAIKYTPEGNIRVFVHDNSKEKKIMIDIIDTGIGMSPDTIEEMFDKFERAANANHVNVTGTGLGLYIARRMARGMNGDITAVSEGEGKGSTFTLTLPLQM